MNTTTLAFAILIKNDAGHPNELWGPYDSAEIASQVKAAYAGVPESATVIPATTDMAFTGCPF